jgi:hypothetical protein
MTQFADAMTDEARARWVKYCKELGIDAIMSQPASGNLASLLSGGLSR